MSAYANQATCMDLSKIKSFTKPLFLIACSGSKQASGRTVLWDIRSSVGERLTANQFDELLKARNRVFHKALSDTNLKPRQRATNVGIVHALDLGGPKQTALYLPAAVRYTGHFYSVLGVKEEVNSLADGGNILIVSALYGLLMPSEQIQNYNFPIGKHYAFSTWRDLVPRLLKRIAEQNGHDSVVALLAGDYLRGLRDLAGLVNVPCFKIKALKYPGANSRGVCSCLGHALINIQKGIPVPEDYECEIYEL